jgi:hypothetical protein
MHAGLRLQHQLLRKPYPYLHSFTELALQRDHRDNEVRTVDKLMHFVFILRRDVSRPV